MVERARDGAGGRRTAPRRTRQSRLRGFSRQRRRPRRGDPREPGHRAAPSTCGRRSGWTVPWDTVTADVATLLGRGYSVSLFTTWTGTTVPQLWIKGMADEEPPDLRPARRARKTVHMIPGMSVGAVTGQLGVVGPWHERLPHFRPSFTPSSGAELQSEYLLPIAHANEAIAGLRARAEQLAPLCRSARSARLQPMTCGSAEPLPPMWLHCTSPGIPTGRASTSCCLGSSACFSPWGLDPTGASASPRPGPSSPTPTPCSTASGNCGIGATLAGVRQRVP